MSWLFTGALLAAAAAQLWLCAAWLYRGSGQGRRT
jgi:hypothetical protein